MSTKKNDDEVFVGHAAHVSQMPDFVLPVPPPEERPATVWHMLAAEEAANTKKTKQSPSGAAHAEQEK